MARIRKPDNNPAKNMPAEFVKKMTDIAVERKTDSTNATHVLKPHYEYDAHKIQWSIANEHERKALIYGLVMFDGFMKMTDIARLFCVKPYEIEKFSDLFHSAKMALKGKIQRNAISLGLQREDLITLKFNLLLQYAEQTMNPVHVGVENERDDKAVTINIVTKESLATEAAAPSIDESTNGLANGISMVAIAPKVQ